jgi:hypothetical protein
MPRGKSDARSVAAFYRRKAAEADAQFIARLGLAPEPTAAGYRWVRRATASLSEGDPVPAGVLPDPPTRAGWPAAVYAARYPTAAAALAAVREAWAYLTAEAQYALKRFAGGCRRGRRGAL